MTDCNPRFRNTCPEKAYLEKQDIRGRTVLGHRSVKIKIRQRPTFP
jgi:hypothetical protein